MFNSFLRAQVSLTWVIGLPLAYALMMGFNFMIMYLSVAVAFTVCGVMVWLLLPPMQEELLLTTDMAEAPRCNRRDTLLLFVICILMWGLNSLYIINMPLFIINELYLPEKLAGVMMGITIELEIPTTLIAGYFAKRLGKRPLICVAAAGGVCFYVGMLMAHSPVTLLGLRLLSATFIGTLGGIEMFYFQDLMSGQTGSATTLYTSTPHVGWVVAGSVAGIVVKIWNYHAVL